jgi:predicted alpha/beta-hydrolase family hydrolase
MAGAAFEAFSDNSVDPPVRGFLHRPTSSAKSGLVFTHGAGGNAKAGLPLAIAEAFAEAGFVVLRCDLPFRQARPFGPPRPNDAARDQGGLKNAAAAMRKLVSGHVFLGGQSYGGRQATMLCAREHELVDGLLLTSYPLHPPGKPNQLRVQHFPELATPALFVSGTRDPFGSIDEIQKALTMIAAKTKLLTAEGVGHDLGFSGKKKSADLPMKILKEFQAFFV